MALLRTSPDEIVRLRAVEALVRAGADDFADALADALAGDPSADVRLSAAHALAARPSSTAAKAALSRAALDPSPDVAVAAAQAVGSLRDPAYAEPLFARLASGSPALRFAVEEALAESYRARPAALVARMEAEHDPEVLSAYARVLERLGAGRRSPPPLEPIVEERLRLGKASPPEREIDEPGVELVVIKMLREEISKLRSDASHRPPRASSLARPARASLSDGSASTRPS